MPRFMRGIHVFAPMKEDVDGPDKPGHDEALHIPITYSMTSFASKTSDTHIVASASANQMP